MPESQRNFVQWLPFSAFQEGETSDDTDDHISVHIEPTPTESTPPFEMKDSAWTIVPCHRTTEYITQDKSYFF